MDQLIVDLTTIDRTGVGGAVWSLPHGGDLDANLVHLPAAASIDEHVNEVLDVLVVVHAGEGELTIGGERHRLRAGVLALVPRGAARSITATANGLTYLSVHRRRDALRIAGANVVNPAHTDIS